MRAIGRDLTTRVVRVKYGHPLGRAPEATPIGTLDTEVFNKSKAMELPRNIVVGHDALHQVGEVCQAVKLGKKALLVAHEHSLKNGEKVSLAAQTPIAVIMDTGVIAESPFRLLASGCGDIISNLAAVKDWALARNLRNEYFSSYAAALSELAAHLVIENASTIKPRLEESAWFVCKALVSSGVAMSIAGSSRPASGSEHKFSHALDRIAKKPGLHGEQCGVGTIMMMYLHAGNWQEVRDALLAIGAPTTARALGVTDDEVVQALVHAHEVNKERYTILGDEGLTLEAAERLAKITKVV